MELESYCDNNVLIVKDFLSKEEARKLSTWMRNFDYSSLPVHSVRFWKQRLFHEAGYNEAFLPVKDITDTLVQRVYEALNLFKQDDWEISGQNFIKMYPGSNPNADKDIMEMFYHIDNQRHMTKLIYWGSVIYPNDNYDGGEIDYPQYNFSYKPEAGSLVFHSGFTTHGVKRVTSGDRFCITGLVEKKYGWNQTPLPTPTNNPDADKYLYPTGYWGNRMFDDPIQGEIKNLRPDGTASDFVQDPANAILDWEAEHRVWR